MKRYITLPENTRGNDYIFGDLHGCYDLFYRKLDEVNLDPAVDRVMLPGDLCDRGDRSLETLELVHLPFVNVTPGNHDGMLLTYLGLRASSYHRPSDFLNNGGNWILDLKDSELERLQKVAQKLLTLPMALIVEGEQPYNVVHGDLSYLDMSQRELERSEVIDEAIADNVLWARSVIATARDVTDHEYAGQIVHISDEPMRAGLNMTYVGHSIVRNPVVHRSHVFLDQGAYVSCKPNAAKLHPHARLQMINHRHFSEWLSKTLANK